MPDRAHRLHPLLAALTGSALLLAACGGSSDRPAPATPTSVRGVAASGGALAGASGLRAPFSLRVSFTQDGLPHTLYSVLPSASAGSANTANITPLTDAVAVLVATRGCSRRALPCAAPTSMARCSSGP